MHLKGTLHGPFFTYWFEHPWGFGYFLAAIRSWMVTRLEAWPNTQARQLRFRETSKLRRTSRGRPRDMKWLQHRGGWKMTKKGSFASCLLCCLTQPVGICSWVGQIDDEKLDSNGIMWYQDSFREKGVWERMYLKHTVLSHIRRIGREKYRQFELLFLFGRM